ncbi:MAG: ATP-grasp domain-containing protein [Bacteroidetes bacterium]|nr:ATP-grasp domain-containing protein [Bacteroidota bacterium]
MEKKTVLLLDGQTVQALPFMESLSRNGYKIIVFCDSKNSYGYRSKYPDERVICPKWANNPEEFKDFFFDFINNRKVDVVVPMNDDSARFLSKHKKDFIDKIKCSIPNYDVFNSGYDKNCLMKTCKKLDLPHPNTADLEEVSLVEASKITGFPAIIKPNHTAGGRGMKIVNSIEELEEFYPNIRKEYGHCHIQKYIRSGGNQFKVQIFTDQKGTVISTVMHKVRYYPEKGGSSACNVTVDRPDLVERGVKILNEIGWEGFADFDMIGDPDDNEVKFMEMNPRIPACIRTSFVSGVDFAEIIINHSLDLPIKEYEYVPGKTLRYLGLEVLWFLKSERRFTTKPNWFKFFGKNVFYQDGSLKDPKPFIYGTFNSFKKLLNPKFRKAKSGLN